MTYEQKFQEVLESQGMYKNGYFGLYLMDEQIDFLIEYVHELREQAERVQELEILYRTEKECSLGLLVRNKRYREVLEFYADRSNYNYGGDSEAMERVSTSKVTDDFGEKARKALEGAE